jgi:hypothetical protein
LLNWASIESIPVLLGPLSTLERMLAANSRAFL